MTTTVASTFGTFSEKELKVLKDAIKELSDVYTMIDAQKDTEKDIINTVFDELKIPKKILRKLAKVYHKRNYAEVTLENEEFGVLYEGVVNPNKD